jgi:hypothetical protein
MGRTGAQGCQHCHHQPWAGWGSTGRRAGLADGTRGQTCGRCSTKA